MAGCAREAPCAQGAQEYELSLSSNEKVPLSIGGSIRSDVEGGR
jgi:hypothetical protein